MKVLIAVLWLLVAGIQSKAETSEKNMKKLILKPGSRSWCCPTNMEKWKLFRWMGMRSK